LAPQIGSAFAKRTRGRLVERLAGQPGCHRVVRETTIAASACVDGPTSTRALELLVMISSPPDTGSDWRNEGLFWLSASTVRSGPARQAASPTAPGCVVPGAPWVSVASMSAPWSWTDAAVWKRPRRRD